MSWYKAIRRKIRRKWNSIRGLYCHIQIARALQRARDQWEKENPNQPKPEGWMKQWRSQEGMIGHSLLHVLGFFKYPGAFYDYENED